MGMYLTLARLDVQKQLQLSEDAMSVVEATEAVIYAPASFAEPSDWVLDLGKAAHTIETVLQVYLSELSKDVVHGFVTGIEVGEDTGYGRPRYLLPERVSALAQLLKSLPPDPLPIADPTGYTPDSRLATDPQLRAVRNNLQMIGVDFGYAEEVAALGCAIAALIDFYQQAEANQQGLLLFLR
ncbi:MAG: DUF1877 family protein [Phormidesmis sp.]